MTKKAQPDGGVFLLYKPYKQESNVKFVGQYRPDALEYRGVR